MVINGVGDRSRGTVEDYDPSFECERTIISSTVSGRAGNMDFLVRRDWPFHSLSCVRSTLHGNVFFPLCFFFFSSSPAPHRHRCLHCGNPLISPKSSKTPSRVLFSVTDSTTSPDDGGGKITSGEQTFISRTASKLLETLLPRTPRRRDSALRQRGRCCVLWRDG